MRKGGTGIEKEIKKHERKIEENEREKKENEEGQTRRYE